MQPTTSTGIRDLVLRRHIKPPENVNMAESDLMKVLVANRSVRYRRKQETMVDSGATSFFVSC